MVSKEDFEILKQLDRVVDCDDFVQVLGFEFPVYPEHLELSKFVRFDGRKYAMYGFTEEQCKKLVYFTRLLVQCRKNSALSSKLVAPTASAAQACKVESMLEKTTTHDQFSKLIENMKRPPPNVISEANKMDTGVFLAVYLGKEDKLRELVEEDPSCVNKKNRYGWTPLHYVMCIGCSDAATILTQAGADPYLLNNEKDNPMVLGAKWGHRSTVNNVCNVLKTLKGPEYVKKLLTIEDYKKRHPLHYAAENKQHVVCDVLLGSGADPNHPDENGQTPTFLACKSGNLDTIKILYKKWNGDIQIADKNNETPFDAFPRDKELIKSL